MSSEGNRIDACFDSHVHWLATGEFSSLLNLSEMHSSADVLALRPEPSHFRGDWLLGFGWDETKWPEKPSLQHLDSAFPNFPVVFTRCDAHAVWVNSQALKRANLKSETGVLVDQAGAAVQKLIPLPSHFEIRRHLLRAVRTFNREGFTHIRDMTCDEPQWNEAVRLDESGLLTLAVEEYFWLKDPQALDSILELCKKARSAQTPNLRVMGPKLFLDGALGSEGACLSHGYHGGNHRGSILWDKAAVMEVLIKTWENGMEAALHAIGDEAADWIVNLGAELKTAGHIGKMHIEHGEVIRPDTIAKMKGLQIECHMQPSHWLSDQKWLKEKLGDLFQFAFPWRRLQEAEVPFDFGSDSPIEPTSIERTLRALRQSSDAGIPRLLGNPLTYMGHNDLSWAPNSFTLLEEDGPFQVVFRGEHLN